MAGTASLTYYIFEGVLVGQAGDQSFHIFAYSGGGGNSTAGKTDPTVVNSVYRLGAVTRGKGKNHQHGGPIPPGRYMIGTPGPHGHFALCAVLSGAAGYHYGRRGGFLIHKSGPHGSDGCIVPKNDSQFYSLMTALSKTKGGTLHVAENMGPERFV